jgi:hypothetical protein
MEADKIELEKGNIQRTGNYLKNVNNEFREYWS